ncbi:MAG TPA: polysaccharide pyruvyl transferase family protein [Actinomycetota bacterium]|nr:polysaccharide pyruvyl transferase family protein [Actinomycetota bacterium]
MRVFVAAWVGSTNAGDELVFEALRRKLAARGARVAVVSVDPDRTREAHGVEAVPSRNVAAVHAAIRRSDRLVLGGGGLLQDETSHLNLPYHLWRPWTARRARIPFAGVGLGAGRLTSSMGRSLVRRALAGSRGVAVRDGESAALLTSLGVRGVVTAADLVLSLEAPAVEPADRLVVCLRSWPSRGRLLPMSLRWRQDLAEERWLDAVAAGLDEAAAATGLDVRFVAFHRGRDDVLHRRVGERMRQTVSFAEPEPDALPREIARGRAVVSMRYHGGILAAMAGRPLVLVGGSAKLGSLAASLGRGAVLLGRDAAAIRGVTRHLDAVLPGATDLPEAVERLRQGERGNDEVLDRLLA